MYFVQRPNVFGRTFLFHCQIKIVTGAVNSLLCKEDSSRLSITVSCIYRTENKS